MQSKFIAVGAVVPFARAGVGAVATQAFANTSYGPEGLRLLADGLAPEEVARRLTADDPQRAQRQFGIVDARGRSATYTGDECFAWAGGVAGDGYCAQGNILAGPKVVDGMVEAFLATSGTLADRIVAALHGGQRFGGDRRGVQSAALLVVKDRGGYGGHNDRYIDLRIDDHPRPIEELERLLGLYKLYFKVEPARLRPIEATLAREIQDLVTRAGYYRGARTARYDDATKAALRDLVHTENLEERWSEADEIDEEVLAFLRARFAG